MDDLKIKKININSIPDDILLSAKADGILFNQKCDYYVIKDGLFNYGFAGILKTSKKKVTFKCAFVTKPHRNKGFYKKLFHFRIKESKKMGIKIVESNCTEMSVSLFLNNGFKTIKKYKNGITKVRNEDI